jgi:hypothetical protein
MALFSDDVQRWVSFGVALFVMLGMGALLWYNRSWNGGLLILFCLSFSFFCSIVANSDSFLLFGLFYL